MEDKINQLIEDYKKEVSDIEASLKNYKYGVVTNTIFEAKASCYRTFIVELERLIKE